MAEVPKFTYEHRLFRRSAAAAAESAGSFGLFVADIGPRCLLDFFGDHDGVQ